MPQNEKGKEKDLLGGGKVTKLERQHFDDLMEGK